MQYDKERKMTKINVLVVDDNRSLVEMIKEYFEDNAETNGITYPTRLKAEEAAIIKALELL